MSPCKMCGPENAKSHCIFWSYDRDGPETRQRGDVTDFVGVLERVNNPSWFISLIPHRQSLDESLTGCQAHSQLIGNLCMCGYMYVAGYTCSRKYWQFVSTWLFLFISKNQGNKIHRTSKIIKVLGVSDSGSNSLMLCLGQEAKTLCSKYMIF